MAFHRGPKIVTDGLVLYVDAANPKSYVSGSATTRSLVGSVTGSLVNGVGFSTGSNGSWVFDGSNDYITGNTAALSGSAFTIGVWVKPLITPVTKTFFSLGNVESANTALHLRFVSDATLRLGFYSNDIDVTVTSVTGKWNYISGTLTTSRLRSVYQNGVLKGSDTATSMFIGNTTYAIGNWVIQGGIQNINAEISSVVIYNRALTASEIQQNYNATKSRFNL